MITIDPNLFANVERAMAQAPTARQDIAGLNVATDIVDVSGTPISSGPRPLAWLELNGYVNLCPQGHVVKAGRRYIYTDQELYAAIDAMNAQPVLNVTTGSPMDAAVATGIIPASARPEKPAVDMAAFRNAFGIT